MSKNTVYGNSVEIFDLKSRVDHLEKLMDASGHGKGYQSMNESKSIGFDNDWKDLDIKAPLEVLINMNKYQIQIYSANEGWRDTEIKDEVQLFEKINNQFTKYRYRLKPLESIRITKQVVTLLGEKIFNHYDEGQGGLNIKLLEQEFGRKVEIIE